MLVAVGLTQCLLHPVLQGRVLVDGDGAAGEFAGRHEAGQRVVEGGFQLAGGRGRDEDIEEDRGHEPSLANGAGV